MGGFFPKLDYPVLFLNKNYCHPQIEVKELEHNIWVKSSAENPLLYKDVILIDSIGYVYEYNKIENLGFTNRFWGFNFSNFNQTIYVNAYLKLIKNLNLDEFITLALKLAHEWDYTTISLGDHPEEILVNIKESKSIKEAMKSLGFHHPFEFPE